MAMGSGVKDENHFVGLHECAHKPLMRPQLMNTRRLPGAGVGVMVPSKAIEGTAQAARARGSRVEKNNLVASVAQMRVAQSADKG